MILKIHPETPSQRQINKVVEVLMAGGIIIYPTDTVYALGCDISNQKALEQVAKLRGIDPAKATFSFICNDISQVSQYAKMHDNQIFKLMKKYLPGPFTFILPASSNVPNFYKNKKKTVGFRIPENLIPREIVKELGHPILSTSIHDDDEILEYTTDPELIYEKYYKLVDLVIDGGFGDNQVSTVIDCTDSIPIITRQGKGIIEI